MIGSSPSSTRRRAAAIGAMWVCAALLSVQFTASTESRSVSARRVTDAGSAESVDTSAALAAHEGGLSTSTVVGFPARDGAMNARHAETVVPEKPAYLCP